MKININKALLERAAFVRTRMEQPRQAAQKARSKAAPKTPAEYQAERAEAAARLELGQQRLDHILNTCFTFVLGSLQANPKYRGVHSRISGFNQMVEEYLQLDPVAVTGLMEQAGLVDVHPVKGGVSLYLPGTRQVAAPKVTKPEDWGVLIKGYERAALAAGEPSTVVPLQPELGVIQADASKREVTRRAEAKATAMREVKNANKLHGNAKGGSRK